MTTAVEERTNTVERYLPEGTELLMHADLAVLPPSVNHTYSSNWRGSYYKKTEVKNWQEAVACIFANKYGNPLPYDGVVGFYIIIKTRTRRNMDIDNRIKSVQDCLSMGRVIKNDSQIWDLRVIRILDKSLKEDCAEVMLFTIPESGSGVYIQKMEEENKDLRKTGQTLCNRVYDVLDGIIDESALEEAADRWETVNRLNNGKGSKGDFTE